MAVLQAHRKGGVGSKLLATLEAEAQRAQGDGIILHAQLVRDGVLQEARLRAARRGVRGGRDAAPGDAEEADLMTSTARTEEGATMKLSERARRDHR